MGICKMSKEILHVHLAVKLNGLLLMYSLPNSQYSLSWATIIYILFLSIDLTIFDIIIVVKTSYQCYCRGIV